jgi:hypothetical protein
LAPKSYVNKIGLHLKKGEQVSLSGWQLQSEKQSSKTQIRVRELTVGGNAYPFRNENMQPIWQQKTVQHHQQTVAPHILHKNKGGERLRTRGVVASHAL